MSKKNYDNHNRWRNKTVAFRVSAEEDLHLEALVKLTGLTKQDTIRMIATIMNGMQEDFAYDQ